MLEKQGVEECDTKKEGKNFEPWTYMINVKILCFETVKQDYEKRRGIDEEIVLREFKKYYKIYPKQRECQIFW